MPDRLFFTDADEACALIARDPLALLIGFALDQQITVQKAFAGPLELQRRLGGLDAARIAATDPGTLESVFKEKPAIHRFPGAMATRVQQLCAFVADRYDGDAGRVWTEAADARDLQRRLGELPGFGEMKVRTVTAVLAKRFAVRPTGIDELIPAHPTLGDVDSPAALTAYQAAKRAKKAAARAEGRVRDGSGRP
jgi:uncharacterized HhH-GPD family protein